MPEIEGKPQKKNNNENNKGSSHFLWTKLFPTFSGHKNRFSIVDLVSCAALTKLHDWGLLSGQRCKCNSNSPYSFDSPSQSTCSYLLLSPQVVVLCILPRVFSCEQWERGCSKPMPFSMKLEACEFHQSRDPICFHS